jgi:hypothetical protein
MIGVDGGEWIPRPAEWRGMERLVGGQFPERVPQRLKPQLNFYVVYSTAEAVPLSKTLNLTH